MSGASNKYVAVGKAILDEECEAEATVTPTATAIGNPKGSSLAAGVRGRCQLLATWLLLLGIAVGAFLLGRFGDGAWWSALAGQRPQAPAPAPPQATPPVPPWEQISRLQLLLLRTASRGHAQKQQIDLIQRQIDLLAAQIRASDGRNPAAEGHARQQLELIGQQLELLGGQAAPYPATKRQDHGQLPPAGPDLATKGQDHDRLPPARPDPASGGRVHAQPPTRPGPASDARAHAPPPAPPKHPPPPPPPGPPAAHGKKEKPPSRPAHAKHGHEHARPQAGPPTTTTTTTLPPPLVNPTLRLVVNSNVHYWKPLNVLLKSLHAAKWAQWDDVVIFVGGSRREIPPHKGLHSWTPDGRGITLVNVTLNNYDQNGMSGLYRYRDRPEVRADTYLYIHDSTTVGKGFVDALRKLRASFRPMEMKRPDSFTSNIYGFTHDLVEAYTTNFDVNLSKRDGLDLEHGHIVRGVRPLAKFARIVTFLRGRQKRGLVDMYHTGFKQTVFWYPDFDVYKYVLWGRYGDIGGDGKLRPNL